MAASNFAAPLKLATGGKQGLAPGVMIEGFSAKFESEFTSARSEEIVFKCGAVGSFELIVNGKSLSRFEDWRGLASKIPYEVEEGKKYKIEIRFKQLYNWQAAIRF